MTNTTNTTRTINALGKRLRTHADLLTTRLAAFQAAHALDFRADVERVLERQRAEHGFNLGIEYAARDVAASHRFLQSRASRSLNASLRTMDRLAEGFRRLALDAEAEGDAVATGRARTYHDAARANYRDADAKRLDAILGR